MSHLSLSLSLICLTYIYASLMCHVIYTYMPHFCVYTLTSPGLNCTSLTDWTILTSTTHCNHTTFHPVMRESTPTMTDEAYTLR